MACDQDQLRPRVRTAYLRREDNDCAMKAKMVIMPGAWIPKRSHGSLRLTQAL